MGILTRKQGAVFVITSDEPTGGVVNKRAPARINAGYEVWTGAHWSHAKDEAIGFQSLDAADEYVRANFAKVTG